MTANNIAVALYGSHLEAEAVISNLLHSGFDVKKLSIIGRNYRVDGSAVDHRNANHCIRFWGESGFFASLLTRHLGMPFRLRLFLRSRCQEIDFCGTGDRPDYRRAGHRDLRRHKVGDELVSMGVPEDSVPLYEAAFKSGKFAVIAQCTGAEAAMALEIIIGSAPESVAEHQVPSVDGGAAAAALAG